MPVARDPKGRTIGRAAREAGVHVETIRYYERIGLTARPRAAAGYRVYPEETVARLRFIKNAQKFGFSLREIRELTGMAEAAAPCAEMCGRIESKLADLDRRIAELLGLRNSLAGLLGKSPRRGSYKNCQVYRALEAAE